MSFDRLVFHESKDRNAAGKKARSKVTYIFKASVNWLFIYSRTCISFKWNVDKFDNEICFLSNLLNTTCKHNMDFFYLYLFLTQPLLILAPTPGENFVHQVGSISYRFTHLLPHFQLMGIRSNHCRSLCSHWYLFRKLSSYQWRTAS